MHDIKAIRDNPTAFDAGWKSRGLEPQTPVLLDLDQTLRAAQTAVQTAQSRRNEDSKLIGQAKAQKDEAKAAALMAEVEALKAEMAAAAETEASVGAELRKRLSELPNIPDAIVPAGADEAGNVEQSRSGDPRRMNNARDHVDIGAGLGGMDFEAAARMSGSRFVVLKKGVARLERAIGQFMLDLQTTQNGYTEVSPPLLVRDEAMFGTGQLPKFEDDLFQTSMAANRPMFAARPDIDVEAITAVPGTEPVASSEAVNRVRGRRWLIPTAEVSLTNLVREQITDEEELPLRLTALTQCFRSEAGSAGRDTRGMIRQHQFQKVELVAITTPEQSAAEHDHMVASAQMVLEKLGLAYRTMLLCTGDMGFTAKKTFDLEVWLPSQNTFREISSISNCGDFQARRMDARSQKRGEKGTRFVHTLNGSGLAVGRTLVAVLENYQDEGGRVFIPEVLQPYMGGLTHLEPSA
ncbi:MAG: serine--tRNA ligase [Caulobacter sp.]|nr:serine--tRNA ligase [Caulobacter sp.]